MRIPYPAFIDYYGVDAQTNPEQYLKDTAKLLALAKDAWDKAQKGGERLTDMAFIEKYSDLNPGEIAELLKPNDKTLTPKGE